MKSQIQWTFKFIKLVVIVRNIFYEDIINVTRVPVFRHPHITAHIMSHKRTDLAKTVISLNSCMRHRTVKQSGAELRALINPFFIALI